MAIIPETIRLFIALFGIGFADSVADFLQPSSLSFQKTSYPAALAISSRFCIYWASVTSNSFLPSLENMQGSDTAVAVPQELTSLKAIISPFCASNGFVCLL